MPEKIFGAVKVVTPFPYVARHVAYVRAIGKTLVVAIDVDDRDVRGDAGRNGARSIRGGQELFQHGSR